MAPWKSGSSSCLTPSQARRSSPRKRKRHVHLNQTFFRANTVLLTTVFRIVITAMSQNRWSFRNPMWFLTIKSIWNLTIMLLSTDHKIGARISVLNIQVQVLMWTESKREKITNISLFMKKSLRNNIGHTSKYRQWTWTSTNILCIMKTTKA